MSQADRALIVVRKLGHVALPLLLICSMLEIGGDISVTVLLLLANMYVFICRPHDSSFFIGDYGAIVVFAFIGLSFVTSPTINGSWIYSPIFLHAFLIYCAVRRLTLDLIYQILLGAISIVSILSIYHFGLRWHHATALGISDFSLFRHQVSGITGVNQNNHPITWFVASPFVCSLIAHQSKRLRSISIACVALSFFVILITFSRAAYLSTVIGLSFVMISTAVFGTRQLWIALKLLLTPFVYSLAATASFGLFPSTLSVMSLYKSESQHLSTTGHLDVFLSSLHLLAATPFLGRGPGSFALLSNGSRPQVFDSYLQGVIEFGPFVAVIAVILVWVTTYHILCCPRLRVWPKLMLLAIGAAASIYNIFWSSILTERLSMDGLFVWYVLAWRSDQKVFGSWQLKSVMSKLALVCLGASMIIGIATKRRNSQLASLLRCQGEQCRNANSNYFTDPAAAVALEADLVRAYSRDCLDSSRFCLENSSSVQVKTAINSVLKLNPNDDGAMSAKGWLALSQNNPREARVHFSAALARVQGSPVYLVARGMCSDRLGDTFAADLDYEQALRLYPWLLLSQWFQSGIRGDPRRADRIINAVLASFGNEKSATSSNARGWIYLYKGDNIEAETEFLKCTRQLPNLGRAWLGLALVLRARKDLVGSKRAFQLSTLLGIVQQRAYDDYGRRSQVMYHTPFPLYSPLPEWFLAYVLSTPKDT